MEKSKSEIVSQVDWTHSQKLWMASSSHRWHKKIKMVARANKRVSKS